MTSKLKLAFVVGVAGTLLTTPMVAPRALAADAPALTVKTGPLGDLSEYITIAKDAQKIAKEGDMAKARIRIKELEKVWDQGEDKRRPMSADAWNDADKLIDKAIGKLRASKPDPEAVNTAMNTLVATLETLNTPK